MASDKTRGYRESQQQLAILREKWPRAFPAQRDAAAMTPAVAVPSQPEPEPAKSPQRLGIAGLKAAWRARQAASA